MRHAAYGHLKQGFNLVIAVTAKVRACCAQEVGGGAVQAAGAGACRQAGGSTAAGAKKVSAADLD
jgi:predicted RNA methylase